MHTAGLVWVTAAGKRLTLAELAAFVDEAQKAGVPDYAQPYVGTAWRGGLKRIAVARPLAKSAGKGPG
jgi:hypothetical protein